MLKNKNKTSGRTFPDIIAEYPKASVSIIIGSILIVVLVLIFSGKHIKVGSFEINGTKDVSTDTIHKTNTVIEVVRDTIFIEKEPQSRNNPASIKKQSEISVKDDKTEIIVKNQPANINTGTNNGIIGNNSTLNNFGEKPFFLNEATKNKLIRFLNLEIKKASKENPTIIISGITGNKKSLDLAKEIKTFLMSKNYSVNPVIGNIMVSESSGSISIVYSEHMESILLDVDMY